MGGDSQMVVEVIEMGEPIVAGVLMVALLRDEEARKITRECQAKLPGCAGIIADSYGTTWRDCVYCQHAKQGRILEKPAWEK